MKRFFSVLAVAAAVLAVSCSGGKNFSKADLEIIHGNSGNLLHIFTVEDSTELYVLRTASEDLDPDVLHGEDFRILSERMLMTVADTVVGGVGLAAPQIGINSRVVAVCRVDKPGEPFEIYPNIHIVSYSSDKETLAEGCLSIPGRRERIERALGVEIEYYNIPQRKIVRDTIRGYTARIFQHEVDHLDGKLYTDHVR